MKGRKKKLWEEINRILWKEWDPIGVAQYEGTRDEYSNYVPSIYKLLIQNESVNIIAHRLYEHAKVSMRLQPNLEHNLSIAKKLIALKNLLNIK